MNVYLSVIEVASLLVVAIFIFGLFHQCPAQLIELGCGIIIVSISVIVDVILSMYSIPGHMVDASTFVAYMLVYFAHKCTMCNLGMVHICGI